MTVEIATTCAVVLHLDETLLYALDVSSRKRADKLGWQPDGSVLARNRLVTPPGAYGSRGLVGCCIEAPTYRNDPLALSYSGYRSLSRFHAVKIPILACEVEERYFKQCLKDHFVYGRSFWFLEHILFAVATLHTVGSRRSATTSEILRCTMLSPPKSNI